MGMWCMGSSYPLIKAGYPCHYSWSLIKTQLGKKENLHNINAWTHFWETALGGLTIPTSHPLSNSGGTALIYPVTQPSRLRNLSINYNFLSLFTLQRKFIIKSSLASDLNPTAAIHAIAIVIWTLIANFKKVLLSASKNSEHLGNAYCVPRTVKNNLFSQ